MNILWTFIFYLRRNWSNPGIKYEVFTGKKKLTQLNKNYEYVSALRIKLLNNSLCVFIYKYTIFIKI